MFISFTSQIWVTKKKGIQIKSTENPCSSLLTVKFTVREQSSWSNHLYIHWLGALSRQAKRGLSSGPVSLRCSLLSVNAFQKVYLLVTRCMSDPGGQAMIIKWLRDTPKPVLWLWPINSVFYIIVNTFSSGETLHTGEGKKGFSELERCWWS